MFSCANLVCWFKLSLSDRSRLSKCFAHHLKAFQCFYFHKRLIELVNRYNVFMFVSLCSIKAKSKEFWVFDKFQENLLKSFFVFVSDRSKDGQRDRETHWKSFAPTNLINLWPGLGKIDRPLWPELCSRQFHCPSLL